MTIKTILNPTSCPSDSLLPEERVANEAWAEEESAEAAEFEGVDGPSGSFATNSPYSADVGQTTSTPAGFVLESERDGPASDELHIRIAESKLAFFRVLLVEDAARAAKKLKDGRRVHKQQRLWISLLFGLGFGLFLFPIELPTKTWEAARAAAFIVWLLVVVYMARRKSPWVSFLKGAAWSLARRAEDARELLEAQGRAVSACQEVANARAEAAEATDAVAAAEKRLQSAKKSYEQAYEAFSAASDLRVSAGVAANKTRGASASERGLRSATAGEDLDLSRADLERERASAATADPERERTSEAVPDLDAASLVACREAEREAKEASQGAFGRVVAARVAEMEATAEAEKAKAARLAAIRALKAAIAMRESAWNAVESATFPVNE